MKLKVFRSNRKNNKSNYDTFEVETKSGMTVLSALFYIQEHFDDSLSFRYSCRGAVCGTCAMLINKVPRLACRTQLTSLLERENEIKLIPHKGLGRTESWDKRTEILIEPLPNLPIIKDLIVDMTKFFKNYEKIEPIFKSTEKIVKKERLMTPEEVHILENYTNCVLCASCFSACPINGEQQKFTGPAALAKLYRFYIDPRENDHIKRLLCANDKSGWWGCKFHMNCQRVCPKGVTPNIGIGSARKELMKLGENAPKD